MEPITTQRLHLRQVTPGDAEALFEYAVNPNVGPAAGWKPHESLEESRKIMAMFIEENEIWGITLKTVDKIIGTIGLHGDIMRPGARCKMLGYALSEQFWGRGIATEASKAVIAYGFDKIGLDMVSVNHYTDNPRSASVIKKCGFICEGTLRKSRIIYTGELKDAVCYSMLKDEYEEVSRKWD